MLNNRKSRTPNVQWKNCRNNCREWRSPCSPRVTRGMGPFLFKDSLSWSIIVKFVYIILRWVLSLTWKSKHTLCIYLDIVWLWRFGTCSAVWFSMPRRVVEGPCQKVRHWDCAPLDQPDPIHQPDPLYQPGPEFKIASSSVDADERADVVYQADVVQGEVLMHGTGEECYLSFPALPRHVLQYVALAGFPCLNPNISWTVFGTQFWISLFQVFHTCRARTIPQMVCWWASQATVAMALS